MKREGLLFASGASFVGDDEGVYVCIEAYVYVCVRFCRTLCN